jgi:hypothetical protein
VEGLRVQELCTPSVFSFDSALLNVAYAGETLRSLCQAPDQDLPKIARVLSASWDGVSLLAKTGRRAQVSNLWVTDRETLAQAMTTTLKNSTVFDTLLVVDVDDLALSPTSTDIDSHADAWQRIENHVFQLRLDGKESQHELSPEATSAMHAFINEVNGIWPRVPADVQAFAIRWPDLALKFSLLLHLGSHDPEQPAPADNGNAAAEPVALVPTPTEIDLEVVTTAIPLTKRSNQLDTGDLVDQIHGIHSLTETTSQSTSEKESPKSSSDEEDFLYDSSSETSELPDSNDPAVPRRPGSSHVDWVKAVQTLDPVVAGQFADIFKAYSPRSPLSDESLAKKYYRARRGSLTASAVRLLGAFYWNAYHETETPVKWRVRDPFKFLSQGPMGTALMICRQHVQTQIKDQEELLSRRHSPGMVKSSLGWAKQAKTPAAWDEMVKPACDGFSALMACGTIAGADTSAFFNVNRDRIAAELGDNPAWLDFAKEQKWPIETFFGFTEEEILELQRQDEQKYQSEIERRHGRFRATLISLTYSALLSPWPDAFQKLIKTRLTPGSAIETWNG